MLSLIKYVKKQSQKKKNKIKKIKIQKILKKMVIPCQFSIDQIIWAKVSSYPWWPARIVKIVIQDDQCIYKVHFFGDQSYSYLQSQYLVEFQLGKQMGENQPGLGLDFKQSVLLAMEAIQQKNGLVSNHNNEQSQSQSMSQFIDGSSKPIQIHAQTNISKVIEIPQSSNEIQSAARRQQSTNFINYQQITEQNVISVITGQGFKSLKILTGYNNRKQTLALQNQLKSILLKKYKLLAFDTDQFPSHSIIKNTSSNPKPLISKKPPSHTIDHLLPKKLHKLIRKLFPISSTQASTLALKLTQSIKYRSKYTKQLKQKVQKIIASLANWKYKPGIIDGGIDGLVEIDINEYSRKQLLENSLCVDEELKKQDEQKSKVTQIENEGH